MLGEFKIDQFFVEKNETPKQSLRGKFESFLMTEVSNKLCAANNFKTNKSKKLFQLLNIH